MRSPRREQRVGAPVPVAGTLLGVAIGIPEPHASVLGWWRRQVGDPQAGWVWPHVTLLPPTPAPGESVEAVRDHLRAAATATGPFVMHLSGTGTFRPVSPVVFVQVAAGLSSCELLERAVRAGPLARRSAFPYHPHVTVAQSLPDDRLDQAYEGLSGFAARFPVASFQLYQQVDGGPWTQAGEFTLGTAGGPLQYTPDLAAWAPG